MWNGCTFKVIIIRGRGISISWPCKLRHCYNAGWSEGPKSGVPFYLLAKHVLCILSLLNYCYMPCDWFVFIHLGKEKLRSNVFASHKQKLLAKILHILEGIRKIILDDIF